MAGDTLANDILGAALISGWRSARDHGLAGLDARECGLDFLQHCLECERPPSGTDGRREPCDAALIHRCADHFAANRARDLGRRCHREVPMPDPGTDGQPTAVASEAPSPDAEALRAAFWQVIEAGLAHLPATQRTYLERRLRQGQSLHEIAVLEGKSEDAVRMAVSRALRHLRDTLVRQGHDAADLYEFLTSPPPITGDERHTGQ